MFLPVTKDWEHFAEFCQSSVDHKIEVILQNLAMETLHKYIDTSKAATWKGKPADATLPLSSYLPATISLNTDQICENPWVSQLDWSLNPFRITKSGIPYKRQRLPNYPSWFVKLWDSKANKIVISRKYRVTPLLLELKWHGHPLIFSKDRKWCFMVNGDDRFTEIWNRFEKIEFPCDSEDYGKFENYIDQAYSFFKLPGFHDETGYLFEKFFFSFFHKRLFKLPFSVPQHVRDLLISASYWNSFSD
jgi:DNA polymerase gamma 1